MAQFFLLIQIIKFCTLAILFSIPHLRKEEEKKKLQLQNHAELKDPTMSNIQNSSLIFNSVAESDFIKSFSQILRYGHENFGSWVYALYFILYDAQVTTWHANNKGYAFKTVKNVTPHTKQLAC